MVYDMSFDKGREDMSHMTHMENHRTLQKFGKW